VEDASTPNAQQIVAASVAASGGPALDAVRSMRRRADMHIESDMFGVLDGKWEISFHPGKNGFQTSSFGSDSSSIGWDGTAGWEQTGAGLRALNQEEIGLNRWLWEMSLLHAMVRDSRADELERIADVTIDDAPQYVLEYEDEQGTTTRIYVDQETSLISRLESSVFLPVLGRTLAMTDYSDYQDVEGIQLPQTTHQVIENLWIVDATFTENQIDPELPESLFEHPAK
jgi:hypothetical protein